MILQPNLARNTGAHEADLATLTQLEENMWREETRFDMPFMERALAPDFSNMDALVVRIRASRLWRCRGN